MSRSGVDAAGNSLANRLRSSIFATLIRPRRRHRLSRRAQDASLASAALIKLLLITATIVAIATIAIYQHVMSAESADVLTSLRLYNSSRASEQSRIFRDIEQLQARATEDFRSNLAAGRDNRLDTQFDRFFPLQSDGTRRSAPDMFDGAAVAQGDRVYGIGAFFADGGRLSRQEKRELLAALNTVRALGRSRVAGTDNFYFFTPTNRMVMFAPDRADRLMFYRETAPASFDFRYEEFMQLSTVRQNPRREMLCTGLRRSIYARSGVSWMSGCITPLDVDGRHIGAWGTSLVLDELVDRFTDNRFPGSTSLIISREGRLIKYSRAGERPHTRNSVEPDTGALRSDDPSQQSFTRITRASDPQLQAIWKATREAGAGRIVYEATLGAYLSIERIDGPDWYAVVAYPAALVAARARGTAIMTFYLGVALLLAQSTALWLIMRRGVVRPLLNLSRRAEALAEHVSNSESPAILPSEAALPVDRRDEIGRIARSFEDMASVVLDEKRRLEDKVAERTRELSESEARYRLLADFASDAILRIAPTGACRYASPSVEEITGFSPTAITGLDMSLLTHPADRSELTAALLETAHTAGRTLSIEYRLLHRDGSWRWLEARMRSVDDASTSADDVIAIVRDISERKLLEARLTEAAAVDMLTGLANRSQFAGAVENGIARALTTSGKVAILVLDIDGFKQVNDTLGHDAGDNLLRTFAQRLRDAVCRADTVVRLGGDEFAIVIPDVGNGEDLLQIAATILARLGEPILHAGRILDCRASIGASLYPDHGSDAAVLLKNADTALYVAKAEARGRMMLFAPQMRSVIKRRLSMLRTARQAIDDDRVTPFYQPQIELGSGRLMGFEALLRWSHRRRGIQSPDTIAPAFDDFELACAISDRMIDRVIADLCRWKGVGLNVGRIAINAAAAEFRRGGFAERLLGKLDAAGIPPSLLELEVTESVFLGRGAECVERALRTLREAGLTVALDDFGTGFASLSHLRQFPVDIIKIDCGFVRGLPEDAENGAIVGAILNLGQSLGIRVVAEGVETEAQLAYLTERRCDLAQGYLIGTPASADCTEAFVRSWQKDIADIEPSRIDDRTGFCNGATGIG